MRSILWIIAVLLIIGWIFGALVYTVGGFIHILLVLAVIAIIWSFLTGRRSV